VLAEGAYIFGHRDERHCFVDDVSPSNLCMAWIRDSHLRNPCASMRTDKEEESPASSRSLQPRPEY
jgi:hypothetical protein